MQPVVLNALDQFRGKIEYFLIAIGSTLAYLLFRIGFYSIGLPITGIVLGAIFSLGAQRFERDSVAPDRWISDINIRISVIMASIYVTGVIVTYRFYTYEMPAIHYILFAVYVGYITLEISQGQSQRRVIPHILILCFVTYWSNQFAFPAGAFQPDTWGEAVPIIDQTLSESTPSFEIFYQSLGALNLSFVSTFKLVGDFGTFTAYALLATLVLTGTILIISLLPKALPSIPEQVGLYAALIFGISGWMLGRGFRPNKLNFFYSLILLLGVSLLYLFSTSNRPRDGRWILITILAGSALVFGHRYSAGAGLFLLFSIFIFSVLQRTILNKQYLDLKTTEGTALFGGYLISVMANPFHQGPLLRRLTDTILIVVGTAASSTSAYSTNAGGPGRYSSLTLDILAISTAAQTLLFAMVIFGFCLCFRKKEWEYDFVTVWVAIISTFLIFAVLQNSADTSPQRFYSQLILFGFNIFAAAGLYYRFNNIHVNLRTIGVVLVIITFGIFSLISPVAHLNTSPMGDEIPHSPKYVTEQSESGADWSERYSIELVSPPITQTGSTTGRIETSDLPDSAFYMYEERRMGESGAIAAGGRTLGGRTWVFVSPPTYETESVMYSNGDTYILQKVSKRMR